MSLSSLARLAINFRLITGKHCNEYLKSKLPYPDTSCVKTAECNNTGSKIDGKEHLRATCQKATLQYGSSRSCTGNAYI